MRNLGQFPSADELSMMLKEIDIDGKFSALIALQRNTIIAIKLKWKKVSNPFTSLPSLFELTESRDFALCVHTSLGYFYGPSTHFKNYFCLRPDLINLQLENRR